MKWWKEKWGKYWGNVRKLFLKSLNLPRQKGKRLWENDQIISLIVRFTKRKEENIVRK
jgi:hypothetical protein